MRIAACKSLKSKQLKTDLTERLKSIALHNIWNVIIKMEFDCHVVCNIQIRVMKLSQSHVAWLRVINK